MQYTLPFIDPSTTSGSQLAEMLSNWSQAVEGSQMGAGRPGGLPAGGFWVCNTDPTNYILYFFNGSFDAGIMTFNPVTARVGFPNGLTTSTTASNGTAEGTPAVPTSRKIVGINSIASSQLLNVDVTLQLAGDQAAGVDLRNHYYGRDANNVQGFIPLPSYNQGLGNHRREVFFEAGDYTFTTDSTCGNIELELYAGGSTVWGACCQGWLDIGPASSHTLHVGGGGDLTHFDGAIICGPDGSFSMNPNLSANINNGAPRRRTSSGSEYGAPGNGGFARISWNIP